MNNKDTMWVDLHMHTLGSGDCLVKVERLLKHCRRIGLDKIAITDHNSIEQAQMANAMAPDRVIVGEEIETTQGEMLGYFLTEWVPPGLTPMETITRLREQNAVISVAHPFDRQRSSRWSNDQLMEILPHIDAIETFNARCLVSKPNNLAAEFAREHSLLETAGSDAHSIFEVGRAGLELPDFADRDGFIAALNKAKVVGKLSPAYVHLFSRFAALVKK